MMRSALTVCTMCTLVFVAAGCESKAGSGALIGGATGAAVGGIIGSNSHARAGEGALIGGAVGAVAGGLVGHSMDESDKRAAQERDQYSRNGGQGWTTQSAYPSGAVQQTVSKQDVIDWTSRGVRDDIIIDRVERSGAVFHLTAADQNKLRDQGVSEPVIQAMRDTGRR